MSITKKHLGKRLLVTDPITGISRDEVKLIEISPSNKRGKFENDSGIKFWQDLDEYELLEVLP